MPEAPVDENRHAPRGERNLRPHSGPGQFQPVVLPVAVTPRVQGPAERQFGLGVLPPVGPHIGRTARIKRVRVVSHSRNTSGATIKILAGTRQLPAHAFTPSRRGGETAAPPAM